jgi:hypothetical protein
VSRPVRVIGLLGPLLAVAAVPDATLYVTASSANLRAAPDADAGIVARVRIATSCVRKSPPSGGFEAVTCQLDGDGGTAEGYLKSELVTPTRPVLATLLAAATDQTSPAATRLVAAERAVMLDVTSAQSREAFRQAFFSAECSTERKDEVPARKAKARRLLAPDPARALMDEALGIHDAVDAAAERCADDRLIRLTFFAAGRVVVEHFRHDPQGQTVTPLSVRTQWSTEALNRAFLNVEGPPWNVWLDSLQAMSLVGVERIGRGRYRHHQSVCGERAALFFQTRPPNYQPRGNDTSCRRWFLIGMNADDYSEVGGCIDSVSRRGSSYLLTVTDYRTGEQVAVKVRVVEPAAAELESPWLSGWFANLYAPAVEDVPVSKENLEMGCP